MHKFWCFLSKSFILFVSCFLLFGCASVGIMREKYTDPEVLPVEELCPESVNWQKICDGIDVTEGVIRRINVEWACVRIDLDTPGLCIAATPFEDCLGKADFLAKTDFRISERPVVWVNTTPFRKNISGEFPNGIVKFNGKEICPPSMKKEYGALCMIPPDSEMDIGWRAAIIDSQLSGELYDYDYVFGGFHQIMKNRKVFNFYKNKRSRTACGLAAGGRFIFLLAACGKNCPTGRNGLNYEECAVILRELGCTDAMEFDGGHSSGLVINGKNKIRPSLQRKVPAALAFYFE